MIRDNQPSIWLKTAGTILLVLAMIPLMIVIGKEICEWWKELDHSVERDDIVPVNAHADTGDDRVTRASETSFPASDPPNWRG